MSAVLFLIGLLIGFVGVITFFHSTPPVIVVIAFCAASIMFMLAGIGWKIIFEDKNK